VSWSRCPAPKVIGHLQLTSTGDPRQAEIKNMAVRQARQGQGIGRRLIQAAVDLVAAEGVATILVATATAAADTGTSLLPAAGLPHAIHRAGRLHARHRTSGERAAGAKITLRLGDLVKLGWS
jgi:GNAT superfamily N-acetyltransferase